MTKYALYSEKTGSIVDIVESYKYAQKRAAILTRPALGKIRIINMSKTDVSASPYRVQGASFREARKHRTARKAARARTGRKY